METITFYSYKGGVGRTLTLANIAMYLSRFKQNVCILDFDLEAPGLNYKFSQFKDQNLIKQGLVDYIYNFTENGIISDSLSDFSVEIIKSTKSKGRVTLIPAGNIYSSEYWKKLASINWHELFYSPKSEGIPFFLDLKEKIKKEFNPDFLLIDSRTGITETSGICTSLLPEKVIFFIVNNKENTEGAKQILHSIYNAKKIPKDKKIDIVLVLSRLPISNKEDNLEKNILIELKDFLNKPSKDYKEQIDIKEICVLHSDRELEFSESLRINHDGVSSETPLFEDYLNLFSKVIPEDKIQANLDQILDEIMYLPRMLKNPEVVQSELEGIVATYLHPKTIERLIEFYFLRNIDKRKLLNTFNRLWKITDPIKSDLIDKYIELFMKTEYYRPEEFNLVCIESYFYSKLTNIELGLKLADAFNFYGDKTQAFQLYSNILEIFPKKEPVILKLVSFLIINNKFQEALEIMDKYNEIIKENFDIILLKFEVLLELNLKDNIINLLSEDKSLEDKMFDTSPILFFRILNFLERSNESRIKLRKSLENAIKDNDRKQIIDIGLIYYEFNREDEFNHIIKILPSENVDRIRIEMRERKRKKRINTTIVSA